MSIKVSTYVPPVSVGTSTGTTTLHEIPESESFEEVLVLNQTALKAMAIDAMVAESATGSVDPDAVNAAAIMKFRSTLGSHIQAPVPEDDWNPGTPQNAPDNAANADSGNITNTVSNVADAVSGNASTDIYPVSNIFNENILECSDELNSYFAEAASSYNVDAKLLKAIAYAESGFDPSNTSHSGAMGVMQLMPETAAECGVTDPYDARQNILGGTRYISNMLEKYNGNLSLALAAYNSGPGNVDRYGGIPPFTETQNYVNKVLEYYNL